MNVTDYLKDIDNHFVNKEMIDMVQAIYKTNMPDYVAKIVSFSSESIFFVDESVRGLSFQEICDAEHDLHVAFTAKNILPLFDCGDNDFIVYCLDDQMWAKFNIVDEILFKKRDCLQKLFN